MRSKTRVYVRRRNDTASLSPFRQDDVEVKLVIPSTITPPRKRGRKPKHQTQENKDDTVKLEPSVGDTDGQWIKTELVMEPDDAINPFIADCELTEDMDVKISPPISDSDDLDPEYDPGNETKVKTHHCATCGKSFRKIVQLRRHEKLCSSELKEELFKEEYLDGDLDDLDRDPMDEFQDAEIFERKVKREYRCDYCPKMTVRREDLKDHVRTTHPEKFESFSMQRQRKRSKIDQEAVNRAKVVVDSRTYYHCSDCGKNLHSPYTYIWHIRIHTGERPYVCDLCGKQFRVSQGLVRHLRETHAGIKNFPCDLCGRMFATRRNVEEHRRIHTNERPYICDLCGKAFKQKASLFVHNRSHTDSFPFKCSYCNQGFRTRPPLLVHVTRHTGEKPYPCDICGRCFRIKYELKRHRLIHSDDKPFSCTDCGLSFRQKRYLRNHNKINHNRPTPYDALWSENQLYFCDKCPFISQHKTKFDDHICKPKIPNESKKQTPTSSNKTDATKQKPHKESGVTTNIKQPTSLKLIKTANKSESTWIDNPDVIISIICDECDSEFNTINELAAHKESHKPAKETTCDIKLKADSDKKSHDVSKPASKNESAETLQKNCQICDKLFMKLAHLKVHIRTHILDKYCYVCCNSYNSQLKLDQHKSQHTEADLAQYKTDPAFVQCSYCVEKFCSKLKLYDHCRTHDYGEYACNKCPKKFNNYRSLNAHKGSHNILYKCKECDKLFAVKQTLFQHLRTHQEKSFECNICSKKFRYRNNLKEHETMHNMLKKYKCDICKQRFARLNYLKTHLRIHFNDKPVTCEYCACTFTQISVKNTHVRSKHRVCTVCNQIVGDSLQLRVHMWKHHPENDHSEDVEYID